MKLKIKKGDTVKVLSGDDKNATGKVLRVMASKNTAIVEGVNLVTKHKKPDAENPDGSIAKMEAPIRISKLQLVIDGEPTRIGRKLDENGKIKRYAKKTGEIID
ncbi:MAG: 50S ribosomal protein L24 [Bacteroidetes bacterium MED-G17]|nr:MAG: 50S ribosomal protein L24 [Bacteroidetes bacterium TMED39]PDH51954.1 MAG: 50S ribosomal protein L24 [Bacteroidetes bacterium MED-G17]CAI8282159.1 MAG: 50S ribosomal protein L24 [Bacteroidetes bacterium MED-G17]|tara:strand:- start:1856 stop:2167 length:312 start_codon:yes stop_codon:yes gene_type:complete